MDVFNIDHCCVCVLERVGERERKDKKVFKFKLTFSLALQSKAKGENQSQMASRNKLCELIKIVFK